MALPLSCKLCGREGEYVRDICGLCDDQTTDAESMGCLAVFSEQSFSLGVTHSQPSLPASSPSLNLNVRIPTLPLWIRPDRKDWRWHGYEGHISCWDCEHLEVAGFPNRRCSLQKTAHIYSNFAKGELLESCADETIADACDGFGVCAELLESDVLMVWKEEPE